MICLQCGAYLKKPKTPCKSCGFQNNSKSASTPIEGVSPGMVACILVLIFVSILAVAFGLMFNNFINGLHNL